MNQPYFVLLFCLVVSLHQALALRRIKRNEEVKANNSKALGDVATTPHVAASPSVTSSALNRDFMRLQVEEPLESDDKNDTNTDEITLIDKVLGNTSTIENALHSGSATESPYRPLMDLKFDLPSPLLSNSTTNQFSSPSQFKSSSSYQSKSPTSDPLHTMPDLLKIKKETEDTAAPTFLLTDHTSTTSKANGHLFEGTKGDFGYTKSHSAWAAEHSVPDDKNQQPQMQTFLNDRSHLTHFGSGFHNTHNSHKVDCGVSSYSARSNNNNNNNQDHRNNLKNNIVNNNANNMETSSSSNNNDNNNSNNNNNKANINVAVKTDDKINNAAVSINGNNENHNGNKNGNNNINNSNNNNIHNHITGSMASITSNGNNNSVGNSNKNNYNANSMDNSRNNNNNKHIVALNRHNNLMNLFNSNVKHNLQKQKEQQQPQQLKPAASLATSHATGFDNKINQFNKQQLQQQTTQIQQQFPTLLTPLQLYAQTGGPQQQLWRPNGNKFAPVENVLKFANMMLYKIGLDGSPFHAKGTQLVVNPSFNANSKSPLSPDTGSITSTTINLSPNSNAAPPISGSLLPMSFGKSNPLLENDDFDTIDYFYNTMDTMPTLRASGATLPAAGPLVFQQQYGINNAAPPFNFFESALDLLLGDEDADDDLEMRCPLHSEKKSAGTDTSDAEGAKDDSKNGLIQVCSCRLIKKQKKNV